MATSSRNFFVSKSEQRALNASLAVGVCMLGLKWYAYAITGSVAIFSDAVESVVHQFAVAFAWYSLRVTYRPPDDEHHYGHDKITYFSAGLEGGLIVVAAIVIIYEAVTKLIVGVTLEQLGIGTALTATAGHRCMDQRRSRGGVTVSLANGILLYRSHSGITVRWQYHFRRREADAQFGRWPYGPHQR
jgi:predicted Co/Zn/Cd cation transporter (cation efflux family)